MKMETEIKVLTLNCWGIVGISKDRRERFHEIGNILSQGEFDFIFLQEVWDHGDYESLKKKVASVLPYSHYFHSGVVGSGCCIFSKGEIIDTAFVKFTLNGYFHKFQHGDWFGGKGGGFCKVSHRGLIFNLYNTHFHAEYDPENDEYLSHRVTQAWELSQFIKLCSNEGDVTIVAGDLNSTTNDIPYQIVKYNANLYDSYEEKENKNISFEYDGATSSHPRNSYIGKAHLKIKPNGERIDHILYGFPNGTNVRCVEYLMPYDKVPNKMFSVSDHEAVVSKLLVKKSEEALGFKADGSCVVETLRSAKLIVQSALQQLRYAKMFYLLLTVMTLILIIFSSAVYVPFPFSIILIPLRVVLTFLLAFGIIMTFVINTNERKALSTTMLSMDTNVSYLCSKKNYSFQ